MVAELDPTAGHGVNAAPVVLYQLLTALAAQDGFRVRFMRVGRKRRSTPAGRDPRPTRGRPRDRGVEFLDPQLVPSAAAPNRPALARPIGGRETDFYPRTVRRPLVGARVGEIAPDAVLVPWSETLTALFADVPGVRVAYYGNTDPKNLTAQGVVARKGERYAY